MEGGFEPQIQGWVHDVDISQAGVLRWVLWDARVFGANALISTIIQNK